jgi:hypothetical protein
MISLPVARHCCALVAALTIVTSIWGATVYAQGQQAAPRLLTYEQQQEKVNAWTVGVAAGRIEGAPLRLAAEMARVVDDGANMLVLSIVTRGPTENLNAPSLSSRRGSGDHQRRRP